MGGGAGEEGRQIGHYHELLALRVSERKVAGFIDHCPRICH